jgi:Protein of unknown function (DUF2793)
MSDTPRFAMPLLDAAQAQKHVTVNEALMRADLLGAARVEERGRSAPPAAPADGEVQIVGAGATGDWAGHEAELALSLNGGWAFVAPWSGCTVWVAAERTRLTWDDGAWVAGHLGGSPGGAATLGRVIEVDHALSGAVSTTAAVIPDKAVVLGVTGRVVAAITGATAWSLGVAGSPDRYGAGYGTAAGAYAHGVTGQPQAYYGATPLTITSSGGAFTGGMVRLAVHVLELGPPAAV